jgi:alcohol dehydrogenase
VLKRGGKILVCGATAGYDPKEDSALHLELRAADHRLQQLLRRQPPGADGPHRPGKVLKPVIDKVLPLKDAAEGVRLIQDREVFGKVIVTP